MYEVRKSIGEYGKVQTESKRIGYFQNVTDLQRFLTANQSDPDFHRWYIAGDATEPLYTNGKNTLLMMPPASSFIE